MTDPREFELIFASKRDYFVRVIARRLRDIGAAEEVVQEAFLQVVTAARSQIIENPEGYLMRVAINLSTDWVRQESSRRRREKQWAEASYAIGASGETASLAPSPAQSVAARDDFRRFEAAMRKLSPQVKTAFTLHKIDGLSHQETAERMGLSRSTVEKHIMKAMRLLVDQMNSVDAMEAAGRLDRQVAQRSASK